MSLFDYMVGYETGKADATQQSGGGGLTIGTIMMAFPTLAEMAAVGFTGAVYSLFPFTAPHITFENMQHKEARARADAKRKKPVSDGKVALAVTLLGPLGVLLKERNRD